MKPKVAYAILLTSIIIIAVCAVRYGSADKQNANENTSKLNNITMNELNNLDKNTFKFGMPIQDVRSKMKELGINPDQIENTSHDDAWNFGCILLYTEEIEIAFDKEDIIYYIAVYNTPTSLDLKSGDALDEMEKKYGKDYKKYPDVNNTLTCEYKMEGYYFNVYFLNDKVHGWGISLYSNMGQKYN